MKYFELLNVSSVLNLFKDKKVPFSFVVAKNESKIKPFIDEYDEKRRELIGSYVTTDENGNWLGKLKEDGTRVTELNTIEDLDVSDMKELIDKINELNETEVEFEVSPIDMGKEYFDTNLNQKSTVEDYLSTNYNPEVIGYMITVGLIKL